MCDFSEIKNKLLNFLSIGLMFAFIPSTGLFALLYYPPIILFFPPLAVLCQIIRNFRMRKQKIKTDY